VLGAAVVIGQKLLLLVRFYGDGNFCCGLGDGEGDGFEAGDEVEDAAVRRW